MSKIVDYVSEDNKNDMLNDVRDSDYDAFVKLSEYLNLMYSVLFTWKGRKTGLLLIL